MFIGIGEKKKADNDMTEELIAIRSFEEKYQLV